MKTYTLNNGNKIPAMGLGTWQMSGTEAVAAVSTGLKLGYRLIDTAAIYGNEKEVGEGIKRSGLNQKEIFVTTKVWNNEHGYDETLKAFDASLKRLGLEYIDLYLIHWPEGGALKETWQALTELHQDGKAKNIGVSNYSVELLKQMRTYSDIVPSVNQIEFHPLIYKEQEELLKYCSANGIVVEAYSPLARQDVLDSDKLESIAEQYGKSVSQVVLRWEVQHLAVPIPKSVNTEHLRDNLDIFDFELSAQEMDLINNLS